jgi:tRNA A-37 threonylcarbamoyl transferase component Bud32
LNKLNQKLNETVNENEKYISRMPGLINFDNQQMLLEMNFLGISLFENFNLPDNWKYQISNIFEYFTNNGIEYPEFNLKNILVINDQISFVDFGLARFNEEYEKEKESYLESKNKKHQEIFIEILDILNEKLAKDMIDKNQRSILYQTFINNMKIENKYPLNIF